MAQSPLGAQYDEVVALTVLRLKKLAQSDDVDAGFAAARERGFIDEEEELFMRECLALDAQYRAGELTPAELSYEQASRLQECASRIKF